MKKNSKNNFSLFPRKAVINPIPEMLNIIVGHYGYEQTEPTKEAVTSSDYHTFRLHFIVKGSVFFCNNGTEKKLKQNSCFLLSPQTESFYKTNPKNPAVIFWVSFSGVDALNLVQNMGFTNTDPTLMLSSPYTKNLLSLFQNTFKPLQEEIISVMLLKNFLGIVEILTENNMLKQITSDKHYKNLYIEQSVKYIADNYNNPELSINDIATHISIHKNYLSSLFKRDMGVTFTQYLMQKRLEQATVLLKNTDYSIANIANMVGYVDPLYFSKLFKKYNNLSPLNYRKKEKNAQSSQ